MKILAIRIKNLASIEGITEIDFTCEPLCSAGIFAITGPTGAGKSTILDALCLALYGQTPRYKNAEKIDLKDVADSKIGQHDVRGILRDGTGDGYAEVDFVGIDGKKYRSQWKVNRARNKATGAMQQYSMVLTSIDSSQVIASLKTDACREIERLVGLNYEQFTRSVLLAQGDFTAFLKADRDAKASLLEKLTGTDIYSRISRQVYENTKRAEQEVTLVRMQMNNVVLLTDEEVAGHIKSIAQLQEKIKQLETQEAIITRSIHWYEQLAVHQQSKNEAEIELNAATKQLSESTDRINQLKIVEQVQMVKSTVEQWTSAQRRLQSNKSLQEAHKERAAELANSLTESVRVIQQFEQRFEEARKNRKLASADLVNATELDTRIVDKARNVITKEQALQTAASVKDLATTKLQDTQAEMNLLDEAVNMLRAWQEKHEDRKSIAENSVIIISKLNDASKLIERISDVQNELLTNHTAIRTNNVSLSAKAQQLANELVELERLQEEKARIEEQIQSIDMSQLEQERKSCERIMLELNAATITWNSLYAELENRDRITGQQQSLKKEIIEKEERLKTIDSLLPGAITEKAAASKRLDKIRLELAKDVAELRKLLTNGDPCPVCGSIEHPYAQHLPAFSNTLELFESDLREKEKAVQDLSIERSSIASFVELSHKELAKLAKAHEASCTRITVLEGAWSAYSIYKDCKSLQKEDITRWLSDFAKNQQDEQQQVSAKITAYNTMRNQFDKIANQFNSKDSSVRLLQQSTALLRQQIENSEHIIISITKQKAEIDFSFEEVCRQLTPYFPNADWVKKWKNEPADFIYRIESFAGDWKQKSSDRESNERRLSTLYTSVDHLQKEVLRCETDFTSKKEALNEAELELSKLRESRSSLFEGRSVDEVEQAFERAISAAEEDLNLAKAKQEKVNGELNREQAAIDQLRKLISNDEEDLAVHLQKINAWIREFNSTEGSTLTLEDLLSFLQYDVSWIGQERKSIQQLYDRQTRAQGIVAETDRQLAKHLKENASAESETALNERQRACREHLSESREELLQLKVFLSNDKENKKRVGSFQKELTGLKIVAENWAKLNEMIGSADGKKFRQVAQEFTLDVMLNYANVHLSKLSRRYELQRIPDSLGLQVVDHDMGDEIRTVYSLSGGESFLVSLALALGLASLSSNNVKVESLFIDEGFGSLDPATLNMAMEALERLHSQGRKVGVISHVQEMKERIMTQIKVTKQSSGKSVITIENGLN